jgi:hypothetical protein
MQPVKGPLITVRCDCKDGQAQVAYGERWSCEACGRTYDTAQIPAGEYARFASLTRRWRLGGYALAALFALVTLLLYLQDEPVNLLIGVPALLVVWFTLMRPFLRGRYRRALAASQSPRWTLRAE